MKVKDLTDIMYYTARVCIYDSLDGWYCYPVYKGVFGEIPQTYMNRVINTIDSETTRIALILKFEEEGTK